ncbi:MAG: hemolysin III family protein [Candidatus Saccharimonadales bacterium]
MNNTAPARTAAVITEEVINSSLHGLGAIAGIAGLIIGLIMLQGAPASYAAAFSVYGVCLIILMLMSCLYHALKFTRARKVFRVLDHSSIFLLIAGSYTPFVMMLYGGWTQALMLAFIWSIAITGITLRAALPKLMSRYGMVVYIAMGWLGLMFIPKLGSLPPSAIWLLFAGGVFYTIGAALLAIKRPFIHTAWHLLVIAAALSHYLAIAQLA